MRNKKGYAGMVAIMIIVTIGVLWMLYEFKNNWLGVANTNLSKDLPKVTNNNISPDIQPEATQAKSISGQLDDLRKNVQDVQSAHDRQIADELNK